VATMSELGRMQLPPRVRRTAVSAGVGAATAGLLAGVLVLGPLASSILLAVAFALAWPLAAVIKHVSDDTPYESPVLVAVLAAGAILCLPGLVKLLGWGALGLITLGVAAGLFVVLDLVIPTDRPKKRRLFRRKLPSERLLRLSRADELEDERLIASLQCPLSIEELCGVWCETTTTLAEGAGLRDRQAVAEVRRICLDEFERRNPEGFNRWIEAGAPSNPGTFLLPHPGE
jgi:hypothetical protein